MRDREVDEKAPSSHRGSVLATLLIAVLGLFALNAGSARFLARNGTNLGNRLVREKWEMLLDQERPADWLFLGDSSCNQGVRPDVFDPLMGVRSLNLCSHAGMLVANDAWMLQEHVERHGPPRGVVLVHVYDIWPRRMSSQVVASSLAHIPLEWGFWRELRPNVELTDSQVQTLFLSRYLPLYSQDRTLRAWLWHPIEQRALVGDLEVDAQGFMPRDARPGGAVRDLRRHVRWLRRAKFRISSINRLALAEIRRLAERHGFPVYLANSPIYSGLLEHPKFRPHDVDLHRALAAEAEKSPRLRYLPEWVVFPEEQMDGADHISPEAARVFTEKLAKAIRAATAAN